MTRLVLAVIFAAAGGAAVHAHHSYAGFYDPKDRTMLLEGTLERILYANPHVVLTIRTGDPDAREVTQVREVRRTSDGWLWKSGAPYASPS